MIGGSEQREYIRSIDLFQEIYEEKGIYFALAFLYDSQYDRTDIKNLMDICIKLNLHKKENKMKIIGVDNFNSETVSDILIAENVDEFWGKKIIELMLDCLCSNSSPYFFKLVDDDYKLYDATSLYR